MMLIEGDVVEKSPNKNGGIPMKKLLSIASGEKTQSETHDYREIAIFKDGVTL